MGRLYFIQVHLAIEIHGKRKRKTQKVEKKTYILMIAIVESGARNIRNGNR